MTETLHSGHGTGSNQMQTNRPPPGKKSPNIRAADQGKKWRERERKKEDGKKKRENGAQPSPVGPRPKRGRGREGKALKRLPQHKVKRPPSKGGPGGAREAATGQTRRLEGFLTKHLLEWAF